MKPIHGILIALALGGGYYYYNRQKNGLPILPTSTGATLSKGASGAAVKKLQSWLVSKGGQVAQLIQQSGGIDGIFGSDTQKALIAATGQSSIPIADVPDVTVASGDDDIVVPYAPGQQPSLDTPIDNVFQFVL